MQTLADKFITEARGSLFSQIANRIAKIMNLVESGSYQYYFSTRGQGHLRLATH